MNTPDRPPLPFSQLISIHAAPRSGSSWLGQLFNSHPDVAYRFQPLFAYRFKERLQPDSDKDEILAFLQDLYLTEDDFIHQRGDKQLGDTPDFTDKSGRPSHLVMKMVRYHWLIPRLLQTVGQSQIICLVRHPCAVINSFIHTPREWQPGWNPEEEWRDAPSKNRGSPNEYFGFNRWKSLAHDFLRLEARYPERVSIVRFEELVCDPLALLEGLFARCGLSLGEQTLNFIRASQNRDDLRHDHGVYKSPEVVDRWRLELPDTIQHAIVEELQGSALARFLAT